MPSLGADMVEGTLVEWLVQPGDTVHRGDLVATIDTAKSAIDVEVFTDGRIERLLVDPGATVAVGTPLALLSPTGAQVEVPTPVPSVPAPKVRARAPKSRPAVTAPQGDRLAASPLARRRARELGVDLHAVHPGHTSGVITVADVVAAAEPRDAQARATAVPSESVDRGAAMRAAIGALMARSKREIPHYYLQQSMDLETALCWLERVNEKRAVSERILPAALLIKATARAAREYPEMNGFFIDGGFMPQERVHVGVAVSLRGGGLIAPALHDADAVSLEELMARMKDLASRARSGHLRSSEMSDPTLTVTNLGDQGVDLVQGVIYPPQVAIVGFGRIVDRPWAIDRMLTVRRSTIATLAADHRVSDGHRGGLYLAAIDAALQEPEGLWT